MHSAGGLKSGSKSVTARYRRLVARRVQAGVSRRGALKQVNQATARAVRYRRVRNRSSTCWLLIRHRDDDDDVAPRSGNTLQYRTGAAEVNRADREAGRGATVPDSRNNVHCSKSTVTAQSKIHQWTTLLFYCNQVIKVSSRSKTVMLLFDDASAAASLSNKNKLEEQGRGCAARRATSGTRRLDVAHHLDTRARRGTAERQAGGTRRSSFTASARHRRRHASGRMKS